MLSHMETTNDMRLVFCSCPTVDVAQSIATSIVNAKLAACANIVHGVRSVYRWQDKIEIDDECQLIIKTSLKCLQALEATITKQHPYELPELIAVTISEGSAAYLDWIRKSTQ